MLGAVPVTGLIPATNGAGSIRQPATTEFLELILSVGVESGAAHSWEVKRVASGGLAETEPDMMTAATARPAPLLQRRSVWPHGAAAAVGASIATTALAAIASAAGVSFADTTGESIALPGFTVLTLVFALVGVGIAAVMARKAQRPRRTFVRTAVALTALSFVPDLTFGFDAGSAATLIALHLVAAAIVVPVLAGRLARTGQTGRLRA
ncbi:MAG: cell envelope biosis protein OmpA [Pseudonocardiales bacterium]|nr:cell envelope biosis protein OmpA [Pseudonocardiales bacterium]